MASVAEVAACVPNGNSDVQRMTDPRLLQFAHWSGGDLSGDRLGEELEVMAIGVVDVEASAPVIGVEFSAALVHGVGAVPQTRRPHATEDRIERVVIDGKRNMMRANLRHVAVVDGDIPNPYDREIPGGTSRAFAADLEIQEVSQELSRTLRIVRWQQEMLDADTHVTQGNHLEGSPSLERPSGTASAARGVRSSGGSMQAAVALYRLRGMAPEQDPAAPELRISRPFQRSSLDGPRDARNAARFFVEAALFGPMEIAIGERVDDGTAHPTLPTPTG